MIKKMNYIPKVDITSSGVRTKLTFADFEVLVIDNKYVDLFSKEQVQLFPVEITNDNIENSYSILTIINEVECIDENKSKFDIYDEHDEIRPDLAGNYKTVYTLKINKAKVKGFDILRIKKYDVAIIVSERLKLKLEQNYVTGIKFKEV
jgi:hypothetical protein